LCTLFNKVLDSVSWRIECASLWIEARKSN